MKRTVVMKWTVMRLALAVLVVAVGMVAGFVYGLLLAVCLLLEY
jgi:hypothetical protein